MTDVIAACKSYLQIDNGVSTLVSTRIYPERLPAASTSAPNTFPAITLQLIDEPQMDTHDFKWHYIARVQVDCWDDTYKGAHSLADAVTAALHGYRGDWSGLVVGGIFRKRKTDLSDTEVQVFRVSMDFQVHYHE